VVGEAYRRHGRIVFGGDGYSRAWEEEAAERGLLNLRTTPEALPHLVTDSTVRVFAERSVLSARELHARYDVLVEQYATQLNIEGHTAARMARTQILPAVLRQRELVANAAGPLTEQMLTELDGPLVDLYAAIEALERALADGPAEGLEHAAHMRDTVVPAMGLVRELADGFEHVVADDLWPLPAYAEMLFIR
jgi:glutamine synthetase